MYIKFEIDINAFQIREGKMLGKMAFYKYLREYFVVPNIYMHVVKNNIQNKCFAENTSF